MAHNSVKRQRDMSKVSFSHRNFQKEKYTEVNVYVKAVKSVVCLFFFGEGATFNSLHTIQTLCQVKLESLQYRWQQQQ